MPAGVAHIWLWFEQVARGRDAVFAPNPLTWTEIFSWAQLTKRQPTDFELRALWAIDAVFIRVMREKQKSNTESK